MDNNIKYYHKIWNNNNNNNNNSIYIVISYNLRRYEGIRLIVADDFIPDNIAEIGFGKPRFTGVQDDVRWSDYQIMVDRSDVIARLHAEVYMSKKSRTNNEV